MESSQFDYKKYLNLFRRRKELFISMTLAIMTASFLTSYTLPRRYESSVTVYIEKSVISELVKGLTAVPSIEDTTNVITYAITSRTILNKVIDEMDLAPGKEGSQRDRLIGNLQASTKVKVKDNNLFTISFSAADPRFARDFLNTLVAVYIQDNLSSKRGESVEANKFINEQIRSFSDKLERAEAQVNAYRSEKGPIISMDEAKVYQDIGVARDKLAEMELKRHQLEGMRQIPRMSEDPQKLKLAELQKKLDDLRVQYTENYPEVIQVKGDIEALKEQMRVRRGRVRMMSPADAQELGRINAEIAALKIGEEGLRRFISTNTALLQQIPAAKAGLEKLETERQNQKNLYDQLFARQGQSEVSKQMEAQDMSTTFRVVDPAGMPSKPTSPNRLKIMLMGMMAAVLGSFGLLLLLEQLDDSVKDVEFVKGLGAPLLAIIPKIEDPSQVSRQRRRSLLFMAAAGAYFLVILSLPVMEFLGLHYVDRMIGQLNSAKIQQQG